MAVLAAARAPDRGPTPARAKALAGAGGIAWWQEDLAAAARFYEEALAIERRLGDPARTADALYNQAFVVAAEGDFEGAFRLFEESLELFRRAGERFRLGDGLVWLAVVYARAGRPADARAAMAEAGALFDDADSPLGMLSVLLGQSYLARWEERYQDAVRLAGAADALRDQVGGRAPLDFLAGFLGDPEAEARAHLPPDVAQRAWREGRTSGVDAALASSAHAG